MDISSLIQDEQQFKEVQKAVRNYLTSINAQDIRQNINKNILSIVLETTCRYYIPNVEDFISILINLNFLRTKKNKLVFSFGYITFNFYELPKPNDIADEAEEFEPYYAPIRKPLIIDQFSIDNIINAIRKEIKKFNKLVKKIFNIKSNYYSSDINNLFVDKESYISPISRNRYYNNRAFRDAEEVGLDEEFNLNDVKYYMPNLKVDDSDYQFHERYSEPTLKLIEARNYLLEVLQQAMSNVFGNNSAIYNPSARSYRITIDNYEIKCYVDFHPVFNHLCYVYFELFKDNERWRRVYIKVHLNELDKQSSRYYDEIVNLLHIYKDYIEFALNRQQQEEEG